MEVVFVRTGGPRDRVHVRRDDGSEASWTFPSDGDGLPRELARWVCERELGVSDGRFAAIAAGADPERVDGRGARGDRLEGVRWSEALAAAPWDGPNDAVVASLRRSCRRLGVELRALTPEDITRTREAIAKMRSRWRRLGPRDAIEERFRATPR